MIGYIRRRNNNTWLLLSALVGCLLAGHVRAMDGEDWQGRDLTARCEASRAQLLQRFQALEATAETPSQQTLLEPFNKLMGELSDASKRAGLMESVHPEAAVREAAEACSRALDALSTEISLSRALYERLQQLDTAGLDGEVQRLVAVLRRDFELAGVALAPARREQVRALQQQLVQWGQDFSRVIREDVRQLRVAPARLRGLPDDFLAAHPADADGLVSLSTRSPDLIPVLSYAEDDALRRELLVLSRSRGYPANAETLKQLLAGREQMAELLGFASYADLVTADKMTGSAEVAADFIDQVAAAALPAAERDLAVLLESLRQQQPEADRVERWQLGYLQQRIKAQQYQVDARALREYFAYGRVKQGLFDLVERLFGVTFRPWQTPVWDTAVEAWEMWDGDTLIGRFYLDMHPREGKYQHAAMFPTRTGIAGVQVPVATLVCNFPGGAGASDKLEFSQVETFFHEFGHLLHELFAGHSAWVRFSGIATEWDFVEAPSQMLEEWVYHPETLQTLAVNDAGEVLGADVIDRLGKARHFNQGVSTRIQMFYAALSLAYHRRAADSLDLDGVMLALEQHYSPLPPVPETHFYANFGHLNGYSAIYYTYLWSQVIALDLFSRFEAEGLLNPETAREYRERVLAPGGSRPAAELIRDFLGRDYGFARFAERLNQP